jgi:hypothetical protein
MQIQGRIHSVYEKTVGTFLSADVAVGAGTINVTDEFVLSGYGGGSVMIDQEAFVIGLTDNPLVMTITPPAAVAHAEGTPVDMYPFVVDKRAKVMTNEQGGGNSSELIDCGMNHALKSMLAIGMREGLEGEWVIIERVGGSMILNQVVQQNYGLLGEAVVSPIPNEFVQTSDGVVPQAAPSFTVLPAFGRVYLKVAPYDNPDPILEFTVYVNGSAAVASRSNMIEVMFDATGSPLSYTSDSSFRLSARDADGSGPISPAVAGRPYKLVDGDLGQGIIDSIAGANQKAIDAQADADQALADALSAINKANAAQADADDAIASVVNQYAVNGSETTAPTTGWSTSTPTRTPGTFVWYRTVVTKGTGTTTTTNPALLTGNTGSTGSQGIQGPAGANGQSLFTWLKYADTPTTGMADLPDGKAYLGIAYNKSTATESTNYADYEWTLVKGANGAAGKGISGTTVTYQIGTSGTDAPTGTWNAAPTATTTGQFLWTRTVTTYTDGTSVTAYSVSAHGAAGSTGGTGSAGRGISSTAVTYQIATSGTTAPTGTWVAAPVATTVGQFLWTRTVTTYTDATTTTAYSVSAHGSTGPQGNQGIQGPVGANGQPTYTWIKYGTSATGAGFSDDPTGKTYIGLAYNKTVQTESETPSDYTWSLIQGPQGPQGIQGPQGSQGIQGPTGANGQALFTWIKYADSPTAGMSDSPTGKTYMGIAYNKTSQTESAVYTDYEWSLIKGADGANGSQGVQGPAGANGQPTYTWIKYGTSVAGAGLSDDPTGKTYIGIAYNKLTQTESTTATDYEWSLIQGPQGTQGPTGNTGNTGATGTGVSSVTPFYQQTATGASAPSNPGTVATPPSPWVAAEPAYATNTELWRTERVAYSNGTYAYTTVSKVSSYVAATAAQTAAIAAAKVYADAVRVMGDSMVVDGSFEDGIVGVNPANGSSVQTSATARSGAKVGRLERSVNIYAGFTWAIGGLRAGRRYRVVFSARVPTTAAAAQNVYSRVNLKRANGTTDYWPTFSGLSVAKDGLWKPVAYEFIVEDDVSPASLAAATLWVQHNGPSALAADYMEIDDVAFYDVTDVTLAQIAAADDAQAKATAAKNAANSYTDTGLATKGRVIASATEPTGVDRNVNNVWWNISGNPPVNKPNRFDPALLQWVPITDKAATDAAAAALAAQNKANEASAAATAAQTSANGKNKTTYGPIPLTNEIAGRINGDMHFIQSSKVIEGVTKIITIGQQRFDGMNWTAETLDGAVLSNIDAGSITVGILNVAALIEAKSIAVELLGAGTMQSDVSWTGLQTIGPLNGRHIVIDPALGLTLYGPDGTTKVIHLSLTELPSLLSGQVNADTVSILKGIELLGNMSKILSGAGLTLESGVSNPATAPSLTQGPILQGGFPGGLGGWVIKGTFWDPDTAKYYRLWWRGSDRTMAVWSISENGAGTAIFETSGPVAGLNNVSDISGIAVVGGIFYINVQEMFSDGNYYWRLGGWASNGQRASSTLLTFAIAEGSPNLAGAGTWRTLVSTGAPGVGVDRFNGLMIACVMKNLNTGTEYLQVDRVASGLSGRAASGYINAITGPRVIRFVGQNDYDYGANSNTVTIAAGTTVWKTNEILGATGGLNMTVDTAKTWSTDTELASEGMVWKANGSNPGWYSFAGDGFARRWSSYFKANGELWWARYVNRNASSGKTTASSPISQSLDLKSRWWPSVSLDALPVGTDASDVFVGYGSAVPATFYKRPETLSGRSMMMTALRSTSGTSTIPTNTFGVGAAAWIRPGLPGWELLGNGEISVPTPTLPAHAVPKSITDAMQENAKVAATGNSNVTTQVQTVPGLTISINCPGPSAVYEVGVYADLRLNAQTISLAANLMVNGVAYGGQLALGGPSGLIIPGAKAWLVTGLAAGTQTFTLQHSNFAGSGNSTITTNTEMLMKRIK